MKNLLSLLLLSALLLSTNSGAQAAQHSPEIGPNDFRVTHAGPEGDAFNPGLAFNPNQGEFLVVWSGDDVRSTSDDEAEILAQRIDSASGLELGSDDFRVSSMGPVGDVAYGAFSPSVAYSAQQNRYLVVWVGDTDQGNLVDDELEVWGQLLDDAGGPVGPHFRISVMAGEGNTAFEARLPQVAYLASSDSFLVVWYGDDNTGGLVDDEFEIFGRFVAPDGSLLNSQIRISSAGGTGNTTFQVFEPQLACNPVDDECMVVWYGDDGSGSLIDEEWEIFGQRVASNGSLVGSAIRISDVGGDADFNYFAYWSDIAFSAYYQRYLVVWVGNDNVSGLSVSEYEVFGQFLDTDGLEVGANDFLISAAGGWGDGLYLAQQPYVAHGPNGGEWGVFWREDNPSQGAGVYEGHFSTVTAAGEVSTPIRVTEDSTTFPGGHRMARLELAADTTSGHFLGVWRSGPPTDPGPPEEFDFDVFGQLLIGERVFVSNFESGDALRWSSVVP